MHHKRIWAAGLLAAVGAVGMSVNSENAANNTEDSWSPFPARTEIPPFAPAAVDSDVLSAALERLRTQYPHLSFAEEAFSVDLAKTPEVTRPASLADVTRFTPPLDGLISPTDLEEGGEFEDVNLPGHVPRQTMALTHYDIQGSNLFFRFQDGNPVDYPAFMDSYVPRAGATPFLIPVRDTSTPGDPPVYGIMIPVEVNRDTGFLVSFTADMGTRAEAGMAPVADMRNAYAAGQYESIAGHPLTPGSKEHAYLGDLTSFHNRSGARVFVLDSPAQALTAAESSLRKNTGDRTEASTVLLHHPRYIEAGDQVYLVALMVPPTSSAQILSSVVRNALDGTSILTHDKSFSLTGQPVIEIWETDPYAVLQPARSPFGSMEKPSLTPTHHPQARTHMNFVLVNEAEHTR